MFRRNRSPSPEIPQEVVLSEMQPIDPHAFIMEQEQSLLASAQIWGEIASSAQAKEGEYYPHIKDGLIETWIANRGPELPSDQVIDRETNKLANELTMYCLISTRHISASDTLLPIGQIKDQFLNIPDHTVNYIIRKKDFPTRAFVLRQGWRVQKMRKADEYASGVLRSLVETYQTQPDEIATLDRLYAEGAAEVDGRYRELQAMISTDWHHPNTDKSILRAFLSDLEQRLDIFMPGFVQKVAAAEREQKFLTIQNLARFAIAARGGTDPVTTEKIAQLLAETYSIWPQFEDIDVAFRTYAQNKINDTFKALTAIAGPRNLKSIRNYPTADEVARLKQHFAASYTPSRQQRRKRARTETKTKELHQLPTPADIAQVAQETEPVKPKELLVAREAPGGYNFNATDTDALVSQFKINDKVVAGEVRQILEWLKTNPVSGASQKLSGRRVKVVRDRKQLPLWRLAPNRAEALNNLSHDSAYMRVVYALTKDEIIIVDILDHASFDQKYI